MIANAFDGLDARSRYLLYAALLHVVKSNSGIGFANADQGHPAYRVGANEGKYDFDAYGDSPESNRLFQMMHSLSVRMNEEAESFESSLELVFSWQDFCHIAVEAHDKTKKK